MRTNKYLITFIKNIEQTHVSEWDFVKCECTQEVMDKIVLALIKRDCAVQARRLNDD